MGEYKVIFELVTSKVLDKGLSVEDFFSWLGTKKVGGESLENWSVNELNERLDEYSNRVTHPSKQGQPFDSGFLDRSDQSADSDQEEIEPPIQASQGLNRMPAESSLMAGCIQSLQLTK